MLNVSLISACEILKEKPINRIKDNITIHLDFMISSPDAVSYTGGIKIKKETLSISIVLAILRVLYQLYFCWHMVVYDRHHIGLFIAGSHSFFTLYDTCHIHTGRDQHNRSQWMGFDQVLPGSKVILI